MDERMAVLNARIDELKAKIAKDRAAHQYGAELYESRYANDPRYRAGMIDYILSGDRGGLDSFASTIQAHQQMEANKELMAAQKVKEEQDRKDEWQKNYQLASADYDYAASAFRNDPNDPLKKAAFVKAATNMDYWGNKMGYAKAGSELPQEVPAEGPTQAQQGKITQAAIDDPEWTNESKAKALEENEKIVDPGEKAEHARKIKARGETKEEIDARRKAKLATAKSDYNKLGILDRINYEKEHPEFNYANGSITGYKK